jgi:FkbH-like protein
MNTADSQPATSPQQPECNIAIAATFTAEPAKDALSFWMEELELSGSIEFAPYNQVFQQLLDPVSLLSHNRKGVNVVLIRLEDWQRFNSRPAGREDVEEHLARNAADLIDAVRTAMARSKTPLILGLCPESPAALAKPDTRDLFAQISKQIAAALQGGIPGLYLIGPDDLNQYPVEVYYDPQRDQLGHIPYTSLFYAALGTILARRVHALKSPACKVIVLDCDNTLWKGVVGEEGIAGITIPPAWSRLQQFMVEQASKGVLLCLCSKNDESDVLDVFEQRPDMVLKRNHLVAWRINWEPKSENIRALAQELGLGLDSFIFLDDNPVECAEVQAGCPEVLTLRLPIEGDIAGFIEHVWAFDRLSMTSEDQQRTAMYKQEIERVRFQKQAMTIEEFLAGLDLQITISEPSPTQVSRVAQLTQRTNQFNFTTVRRNDGEILHLSESGLECRVVEVRDRFGDYGLVGVMIFGVRGDSLEVDSFLLSCRVLGRGVEHCMFNELGKIARQRRVALVNATVISTRKNLPARQFLDRVFADFRHEIEGGWHYCVPSESAATVAYTPEGAQLEAEMAPAPAATGAASPLLDPKAKSQRFERIAIGLSSPSQVFEILQTRAQNRRPRPAVGHPFLAPRNEVEAALAKIWADLLRFEQVGVQDNFFNLGGTSLLAVDLFTQIEHRFGKKLPLTTLIQAPTLEQLARLLTDVSSRESLVLIRDGGDKPPLFLVHDGDGETMLYRNLALLLKPDHAVFGLQPRSQEHVPITHTRIDEMAAYHIDGIRSVQSRGPYLVGGMCAGGVIAFEIARQLQSQGEEVALVALIDAADVAATPKSWRFASQRIHSFSTVFRQNESVRFDRRVSMILTKALGKTKNLTTYLVRQRFIELRDEIRMRLFRFYLSHGRHLPRSLEQIPVRTVYLFAEKTYEAGAPFDGELVLFRATRGEGPDEPYIERYDDRLLGWGKRGTRGVRVFDVPGGHSSMLQEPNVQVLAEQMQAYINEALADESRPPCPGEGRPTPLEPALART